MSAPAPARRSALYEGWVTHRREDPPHAFRQRLAMVYLDLDEVPAVMADHPLWSTRPRHPVQFRRSDYLGPPGVPLGDAVRDLVGLGPEAPVRMLAHLRTWGWCFNPLTLYYCFDAAGAVSHVVASVTNTPWGERHDYVLPAGPSGRVDAAVDKAMHVSPFFGMDQVHHFTLDVPGETLHAGVVNTEEGRRVFRADLRLRRHGPLERAAMTRLLVRHPATTWRVSAGIYAHAGILAAKRAPFHPHPARRSGLRT